NNLFSGATYIGKPEKDPVQALRIYRRVLINANQHLPLRGIDIEVSDPSSDGNKLSLSSVYVDLYTKTRIEKKSEKSRESQKKEEPEFLRIIEAAAIYRQMVVLGDPGSGKSTFVNHLCVCLAAYGLEQSEFWLKRIPGWPRDESSLIPVPVVLRDFARQFSNQQLDADPCHLCDFIYSRLDAQKLTFVKQALNDALENGQAIILLDGLDEVPNKTQRSFIRDTIIAFSNRYPHCRMIVTCRVLSYQDPAWQLDHFPSFELAPFNSQMIDDFIQAWYSELSRLTVVKPENSDDLANRLKQAVRRPDLWNLASNPLLLTVMSLVHTHKQRLPDARSLLYEESVDILLWRWEQIKTGGKDETHGLTQLLRDQGRSELDLKKVLWELAFEAHKKGGGNSNKILSDIGELDLQQALTKLHTTKSRDWAYTIINKIKMRAGLLIEREQAVYTFPHRTFQEYLAGSYLSILKDFASTCSSLAESGAFWREVILLAVGRLVYYSGDSEKPLALVGELCPEQLTNDTLSWQKAWLAGNVLCEIGLKRIEDSNLGKDMKRRVQKRLVQLLEHSALTPVERATAGNVLAKIGDPRFLKDRWYLPDEPLLGFVEIPAGEFLMGSDPKKDLQANDIETPQHKVFLKHYYIARYPVTVAQFKAFVKDSGYKPKYVDCLKGIDTHPVIWVNWVDAVNYCKWLTEKLSNDKNTPKEIAAYINTKGWVIRLPSEAEWEKAARGCDGRIYPWGDDFDVNKVNSQEAEIETTNVVGCFSEGKSPYGIMEMSGNTYEWTNSTWGKNGIELDFKYPYNASDGRENTNSKTYTVIVRGGSYYDDIASVRCARRNWLDPDGRVDLRSFRVVLAPSFSDL
ncbi:signal transduction protein, partial [Candidatus Magnetomorum sp. HK-1]